MLIGIGFERGNIRNMDTGEVQHFTISGQFVLNPNGDLVLQETKIQFCDVNE